MEVKIDNIPNRGADTVYQVPKGHNGPPPPHGGVDVAGNKDKAEDGL